MERASKGRILLGEDDPDQIEVLSELLELEGFEVLVARNARQVVEQLTFHPGAVLLDLHGVTDPSVFSMLETLVPHPAVILLSADANLSEFARRVGADAFLEKPYDVGELLGILAVALEGTALVQEALATISA